MTMSVSTRMTWTWALLSVITAISWALGSKHGDQPFEPNIAITLAVVVFSLVKVRFIIREFMEVRSCANWIKRLSDAWIVAVFALLGGIYYFA